MFRAMKNYFLYAGLIVLLVVSLLAFQNFVPADVDYNLGFKIELANRQCSLAKYSEIIAPITKEKKSVYVNCSFDLIKGDVITKQIIIEGESSSGIQIDCKGGTIDGSFPEMNDTIEIRSRNDVNNLIKPWDPVHDVIIKNCNILGSIRIKGMATNGQGEFLKESSLQDGHTLRAQQAAPTRILIKGSTITGDGRNLFYIAPGVTQVAVDQNKFQGFSTASSIYLDAESKGNLIRGNRFYTKTDHREQIAIDGSFGNIIVRNYFSGLQNGGIYLYRNCGERKTIRHQSPQSNQIIDNQFYYTTTGIDTDRVNQIRLQGDENPSIDIGSRNITTSFDLAKTNGFCSQDLAEFKLMASRLQQGYMIIDNSNPDFINQELLRAGYAKEVRLKVSEFPYPLLAKLGSIVSDKDFAHNNVILNNQILVRSTYNMIQMGSWGNIVGGNYGQLKEFRPVLEGHCYYRHDDVMYRMMASGSAIHRPGKTVRCKDGILSVDAIARFSKDTKETITSETHSFECQRLGSNSGCYQSFSCPEGTYVSKFKAVCDLETGNKISNQVLDGTRWNSIYVSNDADLRRIKVLEILWGGTRFDKYKNVDPGRCMIAGVYSHDNSSSLGVSGTRFSYGCKEHDENGGDCSIRGEVVCSKVSIEQ